MLKYLHRKAPVLALPPLLSTTADKGVRAQSLYSNYVPCIIHNNSSSIRKTMKIPHAKMTNKTQNPPTTLILNCLIAVKKNMVFLRQIIQAL